MIRSMTGFGRTEAEAAGSRYSIEVRSLNNRYLDLQVKMPRGLAALEPRVKKAVQERFARGRFDIAFFRYNEQEVNGKLVVNETAVAQYVGMLRDLKKRHDLSGDVDLSLVAGLAGVITMTEAREDPEALWPALSAGLAQALNGLDRMRREEGLLLAQDIRARLDSVERTIQAVAVQSPASVEAARKRMADALNRLLGEQPEPVRLAQEIAILAERTDVTEELTRLGCHMTRFRSMLDASGSEAVGRKLDFLLQEMGREANTIASKALDARISQDVVELKAELEKIREQAQNIE